MLNAIRVGGSLGPGSYAAPFLTPLGLELNADSFLQFLTIPIYHFKTIKKVGKNFHFMGKKISEIFYNGPGHKDPPPNLYR